MFYRFHQNLLKQINYTVEPLISNSYWAQVQRIKEAKTILQAVYISASGKVEQDPTVDHIDFKGKTEQLPYFSQIIIVRTTIIILQMVNYFNNDCVRWQTTSLLVRFAFAC